MQKSITTFIFDRQKAGKILKQFIQASSYTQSQVAQLAGMTDDMMSNVLAGRNKDIGYERVFKICVITGHSICEFTRLMMEDEDIDFADKIHVLRPIPTEQVPMAQAPDGCVDCLPHNTVVAPQITAQNVKMEEKGFSAEAFNRYVEHSEMLSKENMERFRRIHQENREAAEKQYKASIARYEEQIKIITAEHEKDIQKLEKSHAETVSILTAQNKRLRHTSWILFGLFMVETISIIALLMYDALNPDRGWIQNVLARFKNQNTIDYTMRG